MERNADNYERIAPEDPKTGEIYFNQVLERFDIDLKDPENQLIMNWRKIVGDQMAEHCRCMGVQDKNLYVVCDHPSRASFIRLNAKEMLKNINTIFPELDLRKIITRLGK